VASNGITYYFLGKLLALGKGKHPVSLSPLKKRNIKMKIYRSGD
jgi:hypothetical protein